jgi:hypothetical protein
MTKTMVPLALLLVLLPQDGKGPKNEEVGKKMDALMEVFGKENKAIKKAMAEKKGDAAIKASLTAMKKAAEEAMKLDYLNGSEDEATTFKNLFVLLIDVRMKTFLESSWEGEEGEKLYERLQFNCSTCHELFRKE